MHIYLRQPELQTFEIFECGKARRRGTVERLPAKPVLKAPRAESTSGSVSLALAPQSRDIETATVAIAHVSAYKDTYSAYIYICAYIPVVLHKAVAEVSK